MNAPNKASNVSNLAGEGQTQAELLALVASLQAQLASKPVKAEAKPRIFLSEKGCVCVARMNGTFPLSLYPKQWAKLIELMPDIQEFLKANEANFKPEPSAEERAAKVTATRERLKATLGPKTA
jgi:hypothetical protein